MDAKWTTNVRSLIDNILCTEVCEKGYHPVIKETVEFCYGKYKSFNDAMGTFFETEHDLEEKIYDMYQKYLVSKSILVRQQNIICGFWLLNVSYNPFFRILLLKLIQTQN